MAADTSITFHAGVTDIDGVRGTVLSHLFVDSASTIAETVTALDAWLAAVDAVTQAQILNTNVRILPALPGGLKGAPASGSEMEEGAVLNFTQAGIPYKYGQWVPAVIEAAKSGRAILLTETHVAALATLLTTAPVLGGSYSGMNSDALAALAGGFLPDRKFRRQRNRISRTLV
jgi:hypothetical protein